MTKIKQALIVVIDYILLAIGGEHVRADGVGGVSKNELSGHHLRYVRLCLKYIVLCIHLVTQCGNIFILLCV